MIYSVSKLFGEINMKKVIAIALLLSCSYAWAVPVQWTLNNVSTAGGSVLNGVFTYDADTDSYSDVLIGSVNYGYIPDFGYSDTCCLADFTYDNGLENDSTALTLRLFHIYGSFGNNNLQLDFATALTNSGGTISLLPTSHEASTNGQYGDFETFFVSGSVSAVPVPAAVWLFGSALAGMGWLRRIQTV